jgi:hypothetical protein
MHTYPLAAHTVHVPFYCSLQGTISFIILMICFEKVYIVEAGKELAHTAVRLRLILFSKVTGAFLFRTFGRFLHVPTTQIYCLTGAIFSETHITNTYILKTTMNDLPQYFNCALFSAYTILDRIFKVQM